MIFLNIYIVINIAAVIIYFMLWLLNSSVPTANVCSKIWEITKPAGKVWGKIFFAFLVLFFYPAIVVWYLVMVPLLTIAFFWYFATL